MKYTFFGIMLTFLFSGCAYKASEYKADFRSINELKEFNLKPMSVAKCYYENNNPEVTQIGLRGSTMISPYEGNFADYLEFALKEHLQSAQIFNKNSQYSISGIFIKNHYSANGLVTGNATLSAKFILNYNNQVIFEKVYEIEYEWESSFFGAVAIPNALQNYPLAVQKLINKLMSDKDFLNHIKNQ